MSRFVKGADGTLRGLTRKIRQADGSLVAVTTTTRARPTATNRGTTGVARTVSSLSTVASGTTSSDLDFSGQTTFDLTGKTNVTFNNCKFPRITLGGSGDKTRVFNDCEIDGKQYLAGAAVFGVGGVFNRCKVWNAAQGLSGHTIDFDDSFAGDLWGEAATHSEAVLIGNPGGGAASGFRARGSTLLGNYLPGAPGGGMSGAVACYNHNDGSFAWGPQSGHVISGCWLQSTGTTSGYTVFWSTGSTSNQMDNCLLRDNTFLRASAGGTSAPVGLGDIRPDPNYAGGTGNLIQNNRYDTGELLGAPNVA